MNKKKLFQWQLTSHNTIKEVNINHKFSLKGYTNANGERQVMLTFTSAGKRKRILLDVYVNPKYWDKTTRRLKSKAPNAKDYNLILDHAEAKLTDIKVKYKLSNSVLDLKLLIEEFRNNTPQFDFISFALYHIQHKQISKASKRKENSHINKLKDYKETIPFSSLSVEFFDKYRSYLATEKQNCKNTINTNCKTIMKYINLAKDRYGMKINMDTKLIETQNIKSGRVNLDINEIKRLLEYYHSSFIPKNKKLSLGYFLFSCFTGCRITEVFSIKRKQLDGSVFSFWNNKSKKMQRLKLNNKARSIVEATPNLFIDFLSQQKTNQHIKDCCKAVGIEKNISFHVARHSFATNYLRLGGKLEELKILMGHSSIKTTMIYVHMLDAENIDNIMLFDRI